MCRRRRGPTACVFGPHEQADGLVSLLDAASSVRPPSYAAGPQHGVSRGATSIPRPRVIPPWSPPHGCRGRYGRAGGWQACAGYGNSHPQGIVVGEVLPGLGEADDDLGIQGVVDFGAVEDDVSDPALLLLHH